MAGQVHADKKRASVAVKASDWKALSKAAKSIGLTVSVLFKEASFRMAEEIRNNGSTQITQAPQVDEKQAGSPYTRRYIFIASQEDMTDLETYGKQLGVPTSFLIREGLHRLLTDIRKTGRIKFERPFDAQEGEIK